MTPGVPQLESTVASAPRAACQNTSCGVRGIGGLALPLFCKGDRGRGLPHFLHAAAHHPHHDWQILAELAFGFSLTLSIAIESLAFALAVGLVGRL